MLESEEAVAHTRDVRLAEGVARTAAARFAGGSA